MTNISEQVNIDEQNSGRLERTSGIRTIVRVAPYLWPKGQSEIKYRVVFSMLALIFSKLIAVYTPLIYRDAVNALSDQGINDLFLGAVGLTIAYGVSRIFMNGFQQLRDILFAKVAQRALRKLALKTFLHIHALSLRYHITRQTGGLSRIVERGVKGVEFLLRYILFSIGPLILELLLIAILLYVMLDIRYLGVIFGTIGIYGWFTFKVTEWRVKLRKKMNDQDTDAAQKAVDSLLNFETVKYFNAEQREASRYDMAMAGYEDAALKTAYSLAFLNFGQAILITFGLIIVMVMAAIGVQNGTLNVGDFVMVNAYMIQITMPLNFLGTIYREIRQALVDMGAMFNLLDQKKEIVDGPDAQPINVIKGDIKFSNVQFSYDKKRPILSDLNLDIVGGQKIAIVGSSGSGKSTIGRLLFRFYDVSGGFISIDGQDVRNVTQSSLHNVIGVVPQDTVLFNDSIFYNIAYGKDDATLEEVENAARSAQIHEFVKSLPDGYETTVGERGLKLSGGEKQRVGIARTVLKDPPILLLDEATSALDSETEHEVQDALERAGRGRTVISIAHRLSSISDAERIVVLEKGYIVEMGSHNELLKKRGRYYDLWHLQLNWEES
ncbi:ABC transporter ATP-binding protein/permease [Paracoccaceae bacterium]|nr:ABC transporter ATP-binding protein/permease [Paracoccaceae bacterium]|tara:strand:+ start:11444 stop:13270 length:1827 start_codon:yes stop_codon:yes gene_type:complete